jgi:hypothetical protein
MDAVESPRIGGPIRPIDERVAGSSGPGFWRTSKMKKLLTLFVAALAPAAVAFAPAPASAGHGWHGGGHWRGMAPRTCRLAWRMARLSWLGLSRLELPRMARRGYGWGGWWGPSAALLVSALGLGALPLRLLPLGLLASDASER